MRELVGDDRRGLVGASRRGAAAAGEDAARESRAAGSSTAGPAVTKNPSDRPTTTASGFSAPIRSARPSTSRHRPGASAGVICRRGSASGSGSKASSVRRRPRRAPHRARSVAPTARRRRLLGASSRRRRGRPGAAAPPRRRRRRRSRRSPPGSGRQDRRQQAAAPARSRSPARRAKAPEPRERGPVSSTRRERPARFPARDRDRRQPAAQLHHGDERSDGPGPRAPSPRRGRPPYVLPSRRNCRRKSGRPSRGVRASRSATIRTRRSCSATNSARSSAPRCRSHRPTIRIRAGAARWRRSDRRGRAAARARAKIVASGMVASWVREIRCRCSMGRTDDRKTIGRRRRGYAGRNNGKASGDRAQHVRGLGRWQDFYRYQRAGQPNVSGIVEEAIRGPDRASGHRRRDAVPWPGRARDLVIAAAAQPRLTPSRSSVSVER